MTADEELLTHTCKACGALVHYNRCDVPEGTLLVPVANCPRCGAIIPELHGVTVIAFERPKHHERRH